MSRSYCNKSKEEEMFLCIAESRGDSFIDCNNCPLNDYKVSPTKTEKEIVHLESKYAMDEAMKRFERNSPTKTMEKK